MPVRSTGSASRSSPAAAAGSGAAGVTSPPPWSVVTGGLLVPAGGLGRGTSEILAGRQAGPLAEHGAVGARDSRDSPRALGEGQPAEPRLLQFLDLGLAVHAQLHVLDLVVQLDDGV